MAMMNDLMKSCEYLKATAMLQTLSPLCAIIRNGMHWSSCLSTERSYLKINDFIKKVAETHSGTKASQFDTAK